MPNPVGAPRTTTPPPKEVIKLGEELVKWATEKSPDEKRVHLKQWWSLVKGMTKAQWDALTQVKEFLAYYEKARISIAIRYIDGTIQPAIANRFLRLYFPELKQDEDDIVRLKADLSKKENDNLSNAVAEAIIQLAENTKKEN